MSEGYKCPVCGMVSHHPMDRKYGWCASCNDFTGDTDGQWEDCVLPCRCTHIRHRSPNGELEHRVDRWQGFQPLRDVDDQQRP